MLAYEKGYRVSSDGVVTSGGGKIRKLASQKRGKDERRSFTVSTPFGVYPIPVHRLVAYQKFSEAMIEPGFVVRHLDGDACNNALDNIAIGTASDNSMDRPPLARQLHAQKGSRGQGRLDDITWALVQADYDAGVGYKKLRTKYGVNVSTLSYRLSKKAAYRILENR